MNLLKYISLFIFICLVAGIATDVIRRYSIKYKLYDVPNNRSSHDIPKPKGGGLSIVLILLITIGYLFFNHQIDSDISVSLLIGLSLVAVVGFIDDYKNLSISIRAVAYVLAAVVSIYLIGGVSALSINNYPVQLNEFGYLFAVLFVVWITNLYNFMDGTDGFAAIQTICVALFCGVLLFLSANTSYAILLFCLVASTLGFLYWNWSPAKIFMGDVGSCTIGFLFALLSLYTEKAEMLSISVWLILLAPFIGDATFTLFKRIINKEKWYKAHNSHAYQRLYRSGLTHSQLAIGLLGTNIIIIWPFAYFAHTYKNLELVMLILSYCIIGIIWISVQNKNKKNNFKNIKES
jgi:Fuc2NAc and GlcNAc transferase